jgi:hypothetical protein
MNTTCPSAEKCPIFNGILKDKQFTSNAYRQQFCEAGESGRNNCKRWQCKNRYGKVPEDLLPNAKLSLEEIGKNAKYI